MFNFRCRLPIEQGRKGEKDRKEGKNKKVKGKRAGIS